MTWSSPLLLESGNIFNEDDTTTEQTGDRELSRKRQSLSKKPRREDEEEKEKRGGERPEEGQRVAGDYSLVTSSSFGRCHFFE